MQPYLFPYIGYFQLIQAVDKFVVYDDVAFIKQGWINRNQILLNKNKHMFHIPLDGASSFRRINEIYVSYNPLNWETKFFKTLNQAYRKAPFYDKILPLIESVILKQQGVPISEVALKSISKISEYIQLKTQIIESSSVYNNHELNGEDRIKDICKRENAKIYINAIGGKKLYDKADFATIGVNLFFLEGELKPYKQFKNDPIPGLSIIDTLMFCPPEEIKNILTHYRLV